jgi:hypothetical protein
MASEKRYSLEYNTILKNKQTILTFSRQQTANLSRGSMLQKYPVGQSCLEEPRPQKIFGKGRPTSHVPIAKTCGITLKKTNYVH